MADGEYAPEVYDQCCAILGECDRLQAEVEKAVEAGIPFAERGLEPIEEIRARNRGRIRVYFPGQPIPGEAPKRGRKR